MVKTNPTILQTRKLDKMAKSKKYKTALAGILYWVFPKVYPGGTDSELLCDKIEAKKNDSFLDIGSGTGIVALKARSLGTKNVTATDLNPQALKNIKFNSERSKFNITVTRSDVFEKISGKFDVISFNPPYSDREASNDYEICFWDKDNESTKRFFQGLRSHLNKNGKAYVCWSSFGKKRLISDLAKRNDLGCKIIGRRQGTHRHWYFVYKIICQ
ncbi:MAG: HemK2/MTQ2 family protein methyltransferase [Minisyncoccia bacterium]|jgi:release factor glutamine methyltransferase